MLADILWSDQKLDGPAVSSLGKWEMSVQPVWRLWGTFSSAVKH